MPPPGNTNGAWSQLEDQVLAETNAHRSRGAFCGGRYFQPAPPVTAESALRRAARGHSRDMALRGYFEHTSPEGVGPGGRARAAGYTSPYVSENIAAGHETARSVVADWMASPGHCVNIMDPEVTVLGVGYFHHDDGLGHYWTQNFGG